jgi:hypothetical protein
MHKKFYILLVISLLSINISKGQVLISLVLGDKLNSDKLEFGLDGGFNWSNISNLESSNMQRSFNLGFYFNIKMKEKLFLRTGVIVKSPMGAGSLPSYSLNKPELDTVLAESSVSRKLRYFNVPILIRYKFYDQFFVELGPQLGLLNKARDEFNTEVYQKDDLSFTNNIKDDYKKFDAGFTVGIGYQLMQGTGMTFGVRYYYGLMLSKTDPSTCLPVSP